MSRPRLWRAAGVALLACLLASVMATSAATSLQVAPTTLQLEPRQRAAELWLTNSGTAPVKLQVRVSAGSSRMAGSSCCLPMGCWRPHRCRNWPQASSSWCG